MANASRDNNNIPVKLALLNTDGSTLVPVQANPSTHSLKYDDGVTGSDNGGHISRDENFVTTMCAVSSSDGTTLVPLYATSAGKLLIKST